MKKLNFMFLLICFTLCSCNKSGVKQFVGDYTFKTSGFYTISTLTSSFDVDMTEEIGQLKIIDIDEADRVLVVRNTLNGSVSTCYATIEDDKIFFDDMDENHNVKALSLSGNSKVTTSAKGVIYGDIIVIDETYSGTFSGTLITDMVLTFITGTIGNSDITTVATRNAD